MGVASLRAFASALRDLDRDGFGAFVRDLLEARGYEIDPAGEGVLLASNDDRERTVFLHHPGRLRLRSPTPPDRAVDVLFTSRLDDERARGLAADLDADLLDAADLRRLLLYGLDRETAEGIALTHLGRSLSMPEEESDGTTQKPAASLWRRLPTVIPGRRDMLVAAAVFCVVLAAAALGTVVLTGFGAPGTASDAASEARGAPGVGAGPESDLSVTPAPAASTVGRQLEGTNESLEVLPPGLNESGITDAEALARAHEKALSNRSYRLVLTYEEYVDGRPTGAMREVVTIERPGVYSVALQRRGDPLLDPLLFAEEEAYADGERRYERVRVAGSREDVRSTDLGIEEPGFRDRAATYVEWYLSASRSAITGVREEGDRTRYLVETAGDPYPGAENARASAVVDSQGMVHRLQSDREFPDGDVRVVMTFRYTDVGNATVSPPAWYASNVSGNATASNGTTAAAATGEG
jgi:hypothetical protein